MYFQATDTELSDSQQISQKNRKKKKKKFNLNRNVLISQMKERVEAAFVAAESADEACADEACAESADESAVESADDSAGRPEPTQPPTPPNKQVSEESNSSEATNPNEDVKIKNAILRNCFASLHKRQKKQQEEEYSQYLNGN